VNDLKTERAEFLVENLDLPAATGVDGARWEHFQIEHLNDDSTFRIENKSRQIAFSWTCAAEAVAEAILDAQSSVFGSINLEEAKQKIRYARLVYEVLGRRVRNLPRLTKDNDQLLELDNGARIVSHPAKAPRGMPGYNVILDEFAHVQHDRKVYVGAVPVLSKGGRLRMGSSPFGASGIFWEVYSEAMEPYPQYTRKTTPWWEAQAFCKNVAEARCLAPAMPTRHRVELFGTDAIKAIYGSLPEEDFRQEYECAFVDEVSAWITFDEIKANQVADLACVLVDGVSAAYEAISELQRRIALGQIEAVLACGADIGRTKNATEIFFVGVSTLHSYPLRLAITLQNCEFDDQFAVMAHALQHLPLTAMLIDQNGIGRNLAENLERHFPAKALGVDFTGPSKTLWATDAKMLVQQKRTPLPVDRDIAYQIHSIKRKVTAAKNLVFDTDANERHHADKFWAWALALVAATAVLPQPEVLTIEDDERVHISPY
jgi:phage FluMu gp28-like protein